MCFPNANGFVKQATRKVRCTVMRAALELVTPNALTEVALFEKQTMVDMLDGTGRVAGPDV